MSGAKPPYSREGRLGRKLARTEDRLQDLERTLRHIAKTTSDRVTAAIARKALDENQESEGGQS